jgi:hypothetical protein
MQIGLLPVLTAQEKGILRSWMINALGRDQLVHSAGTAFPYRSRRIGVYVEGTWTQIAGNTNWSQDGTNIYVGQTAGGNMPLCDRLAVLAAIITATSLWDDEMTAAYSTAVTRTLLESYNTMMAGLLHGQVPATGLAFNAARTQAAARMNDHWYLPGGVEVEPDDTWTVVQ